MFHAHKAPFTVVSPFSGREDMAPALVFVEHKGRFGAGPTRLRTVGYQRDSAAPTSSRLARLWPLAKWSTWGRAAFMPRASGS